MIIHYRASGKERKKLAEAIAKEIPEFMRHNIVESEVRNVV